MQFCDGIVSRSCWIVFFTCCLSGVRFAAVDGTTGRMGVNFAGGVEMAWRRGVWFSAGCGMTWRMVGGDIRFPCPFLAFAGDLIGELLRFMV